MTISNVFDDALFIHIDPKKQAIDTFAAMKDCFQI